MEFKKRQVKVIILSGKAGSGKSFVANKLNEKLSNSIVISYASYLKEYVKNISNWDGSEESKEEVRTLLQQIGVELIKNKIDDKFLINRVLQDVEVYSYFFDYIIISDARFIDEIECIKNESNSFVINIIGKDNNLTNEEKKHSTEVSLDDYDNFDYILDNRKENIESDIENIIKKVGELNE